MLNIEGPVTIYTDKRKALRRLRLRMLLAAPVCLLAFAMLSALPGPIDPFTNLIRWVLVAEVPLLYFLVSRGLNKQARPIVSLSSQGISVNTLGTQVGFLPWSEIKDIYTYNLGYRFIGVTLNNPKALYERIGLKGSWLLRLNGLVAPLYKPFRIRVAPINIPQEYLPMTADELMAQIEAYRTLYS